jgi:hypothetical protein
MQHKTTLDFAEAVICWQLHWLGHHQFKINQRCVHEVLRLKKHLGSREAAQLKRTG